MNERGPFLFTILHGLLEALIKGVPEHLNLQILFPKVLNAVNFVLGRVVRHEDAAVNFKLCADERHTLRVISN